MTGISRIFGETQVSASRPTGSNTNVDSTNFTVPVGKSSLTNSGVGTTVERTCPTTEGNVEIFVTDFDDVASALKAGDNVTDTSIALQNLINETFGNNSTFMNYYTKYANQTYSSRFVLEGFEAYFA